MANIVQRYIKLSTPGDVKYLLRRTYNTLETLYKMKQQISIDMFHH